MASRLLTLPPELLSKILEDLMVLQSPVYQNGAVGISYETASEGEITVLGPRQIINDGKPLPGGFPKLDFSKNMLALESTKRFKFELTAVDATSQLLRTCKTLLDIGRKILYGRNIFVLSHIIHLIDLREYIGLESVNEITSLRLVPLSLFIKDGTLFTQPFPRPFTFEKWPSTYWAPRYLYQTLTLLRGMRRLRSATVDVVFSLCAYDLMGYCAEYLRVLSHDVPYDEHKGAGWLGDAVTITGDNRVEWSLRIVSVEGADRYASVPKSCAEIYIPARIKGEMSLTRKDRMPLYFSRLTRMSCKITRGVRTGVNRRPTGDAKSKQLVKIEGREISNGGVWKDWEVIKEVECTNL